MPSDPDIYESLDSALLALGAPTRDLVISAFESKGVRFRPQAVDVKSVDRILIELFGFGSDAIIDLAWSRLNSRLVMGFDESKVTDPVEKIRIWLEVNSNREESVA